MAPCTGRSRLPDSVQTGTHDHLAALIARRARGEFRKPVAAFSVAAFASFSRTCDPARALIVDSCCGGGESTRHLA